MRYSDGAAGPAWNGLSQVPPHGFGGGLPPAVGDYYMLRETNSDELLADGRMPTAERVTGTHETARNKVAHLVLARGDVFVAGSGGGGGLGDPLLRAPELVARDVADRYVSSELAAVAYGVILSAAGAVDESATSERRAELLRERIGREPERVMSAPETVGVAVRRGDEGWVCAYCAATIAGAGGDWREGDGVVVREAPMADRFASLGMHVRDRVEAPRVVLREHFCGMCGGSLGAETLTDGKEE
jgi:N-methylhydantoinase B